MSLQRPPRCAAALLLVALTAARSASAQPYGSEFQANTYTTGLQGNSAVAGGSSTFVVVWEDPAEDGSSYGIFARRFTSASKPGPLGSEFRVNTSTSGAQRYPAVAMTPAGAFIVAWESVSLDNSSSDVMAQRYDASGAPISAEFRVNTTTTGVGGVRRFATVASDAVGNFVIAWNRYNEGDQAYGIFAQLFASSGARVGGEFHVNNTTGYNQTRPSAAFAGNGSSFVIVWQHASPADVYAQRYSSSGAPLGDEFRVSRYVGLNEDHASVAADSAGNFTVVWRGSNEDGPAFTYGVHARRYASSGAPLGSEFRADTATAPGLALVNPNVASDASGNLTVVWQGYDASSRGVLARRYSPTGAPFSDPFVVNSFTALSQMYPAVADVGGPFVVVWTSHTITGDDFNIYGKRYPGEGDVNGNGVVDVADVFYLINFLFAGGPDPIGPGDVSGNGAVDVSDVFYLINSLFAGGPAPK